MNLNFNLYLLINLPVLYSILLFITILIWIAILTRRPQKHLINSHTICFKQLKWAPCLHQVSGNIRENSDIFIYSQTENCKGREKAMFRHACLLQLERSWGTSISHHLFFFAKKPPSNSENN